MNKSVEAGTTPRSRFKHIGYAAVLIAALMAPFAFGALAWAQSEHFPNARETDEQLLELYDQAADVCVRSQSRDVQVAVACLSMSVYGMALNERGLCRGREDEVNAFHEWHECEAGSLRFDEVELPCGLLT